jgi:hypothetical protein
MTENEFALQDAGGKVYFVDFQKKIISKNRTIIKNEDNKPLGEIAFIGPKPELTRIHPAVTEKDVEHCTGKKITYINLRASPSDVIHPLETEPIARIYKRCA